ncbi:MAG: hypothetical protein QM770_24425 [Tepidisphaeraceae bacterium]
MDTPRLLVLTGNCGVGKTTISNAWADARRGAAIHADDIHLWIRDRPLHRARNYQEELKLAVTITAAERLLEQGLSVAVDNVWYPPMLHRLRDTFSVKAPVACVRLTCARAINRARDMARPVGRMGARVDELGNEMDTLDWPDWLMTIDTSAMSVDETLATIDGRFLT